MQHRRGLSSSAPKALDQTQLHLLPVFSPKLGLFATIRAILHTVSKKANIIFILPTRRSKSTQDILSLVAYSYQ